jgi:uncharacterized protein (TIGR03083 family)
VDDPPGYVDHLRSDTERLARAYELGPATAAVAACPGWDVAALVTHVAYIHRWATAAATNAAAPERGAVDTPSDGDDLAAWLRAGGARLGDVLYAADPDAPTWHPFPVPQQMWVWERRQALETAVHRWDAEVATTGSSSLDPGLASAGIQEYFDLGLPRVLQRGPLPDGTDVAGSSLHVRCTDTTGEWLVTASADPSGTVSVRTDPEVRDDGDATVRGTAETLLLVLMGRAGRDRIDTGGDETVVDAWLGLPGW